MRTPTKSDSLARLRPLGIRTVIDVGVARCTESLMQVFPDAHHILIESDPRWIASYRETYKDISHEVHNWEANDSSHCVDSIECKGPVLLKIDVDGPEMKVLAGSMGLVRYPAVIVIEATMDKIFTIGPHLQWFGFCLFDVVDLCYCGPQLHQCDLVFVRRDVLGLVSVPFDLEKYQDSSLLDWSPKSHQN